MTSRWQSPFVARRFATPAIITNIWSLRTAQKLATAAFLVVGFALFGVCSTGAAETGFPGFSALTASPAVNVDANCQSLKLPAVETCKKGGNGTDKDDVTLPSTKCPKGAEIKSANVGLITINAGAQLVETDEDAMTPDTLRTRGISVQSGGRLILGSAKCPIGFTNPKDRLTIIFHGDRVGCPATDDANSDTPACHQKGVVVNAGGIVQMYGMKGNPTSGGVNWTYLAQAAGPNSYSSGQDVLTPSKGPDKLYLADDVTAATQKPHAGWQQGDWVVVATTSFSPFESEFVEINAVTPHKPTANEPWSTVLTLKKPLQYYHFGGPDPYAADGGKPGPNSYSADSKTNYGVDERAEVGLISRNIVLTSDADTSQKTAHWGGEVRILKDFTSVQIQGVELQKFGKEHLGSYPLHLHMTDDLAKKDVLLDSDSVDHSYNKCVTVHMTSNVKISNMVCARIVGHIFYEEVGTEDNVTFTDNLGVGAMSNGFDVNNGASDTNGDDRQQLVSKYWWKGDNMVAPPSAENTRVRAVGEGEKYDGFRIINTDAITNPSHGVCQVYNHFQIKGEDFYDGSLNNPPGPYNLNPLLNKPQGCSQIPDSVYYEPASGFWITNMSTKLNGNSIAGCQGFGNAYWWVPTPYSQYVPVGVEYAAQKHGEFVNNRGHGCQSGIYSEGERTISQQPFGYEGGTKDASHHILMNIIDGITLTRNRNRGLWLRPSFYLVRNARLATNRLSASLVTSGGPDGNYPGEYSYLHDSVTVGITQNNVDRWGNPNCTSSVTPPGISQVGGGSWGCLDQTAAKLGSKPTGADYINLGYDMPAYNMLGYMIYDGPALIFHDRFVNFRIDPTSTGGGMTNLLDKADATFLANYPYTNNPNHVYEGDAALGWFNSANPSAYPILTASKQLTFTGVDLRHQVFTQTVNTGSFADGDKNTTIYDLDATLSGLALADANGKVPTDYFPVSLNNLGFNATGYVAGGNICGGKTIGTVDECKSAGGQNTLLEGIPSANMSPAEIASLEFQAQFPLQTPLPTPPNKPIVIAQDLTFTRDDLDFTTVESANYHSAMTLKSRNSQGIWEPKVASGFGYTVSAAAGIPKIVQVGLVDAAKPHMDTNPFYVRVGICYTGTNGYRPTSADSFTITRGYQSWGGGGVEEFDPLVRLAYNQLDAGLYGDQTTPGNGYCYNLTNQSPGDSTTGQWLDEKLCPSKGISLAPNSSCSNADGGCPSGTTCTTDKVGKAICVYPTNNLTKVSSISLLAPGGTPDPTKYFYDSSTGMLYFYVVQAEPNAPGQTPIGNCVDNTGGDTSFCPANAGGFDTYYVCPAEGCGQVKVTLNDSNYVPAASTCAPYPTYNQTVPPMDYHLTLAGSSSTPLCRTESIGVSKQFPHYKSNANPACP